MRILQWSKGKERCMKEDYSVPQMDIILLDEVVTTSGTGGDPNQGSWVLCPTDL